MEEFKWIKNTKSYEDILKSLDGKSLLNHYDSILKIDDLKVRKKFLIKYYTEKLRKPVYVTGLSSIISEKEFDKYVNNWVEYDLTCEKPNAFGSYRQPRLSIFVRLKCLLYEAKVCGFKTLKECEKWKDENKVILI